MTMTAAATTSIFATAVTCSHHGLSTIPIQPGHEKKAAVAWKPYQTERATPDQVRGWFGPDDGTLGLAVITGSISGRLELLELEGAARPMLGALDKTLTAAGLGELWRHIFDGWADESPSGGLHLHYRLADDGTPMPGNTKIARDADGHVLAESRGEGGYVIIAPTPGTYHQTGNPWRRISGGPETIRTITAQQRADLYEAIRACLDQPRTPNTNAPAADTPRVEQTADTPGNAFEHATPWAEILEPHGWEQVYTSGRTTYWRRPGKTIGLSATTGHAEDRDRLYVFSSSTVFEPEQPYTKFAAHAILNHDGDYKTAARELARAGFGPQPDRQQGDLARKLEQRLQERQQATTAANAAVMDEDTGMQVDPATGEIIDTDEPNNESDTNGESTLEHDDTDIAPDGLPASWAPINLAPYLDGTYQPPQPTLWTRTDGHALIYPGLVHDVHGESESGKSFIVQAEIATQLQQGQRCLYIDYESDAGAIIDRLQTLGATPQQLNTNFTYIRPESNPYNDFEQDAWIDILTGNYTLAIIDGVTDALGQHGASTKDNDDIAAWHRQVPRTIARKTGAAVILIDHVVKDGEGRGRFAIGGQAKMAAIDGASYSVEVEEPIGQGLAGTISVRVAKDRPGQVRPHSGKWDKKDRTQEAARIHIDSTGETTVVTVEPSDTSIHDEEKNAGKEFRPTGAMEKLSRLLETMREGMGVNALDRAYRDDGGKGKRTLVLSAINLLVDEGYATEQAGPNNSRIVRHQLVYRQQNDPLSEHYTPPFGVRDAS